MQIGIYAYITTFLFVSVSNFLINLIQTYWILTNPGRVTVYYYISNPHFFLCVWGGKSISFLYEKTSKRGALKYHKNIQYPANKDTEGNLPTRGRGRGTLVHAKLQKHSPHWLWQLTLPVTVGSSLFPVFLEEAPQLPSEQVAAHWAPFWEIQCPSSLFVKFNNFYFFPL